MLRSSLPDQPLHRIREGRQAKNIGGRNLRKSFIYCELANEYEGRPEIGVGTLLTKLIHGGLEGGGHVACLYKALIKGLHELGGAAVMDIPE